MVNIENFLKRHNPVWETPATCWQDGLPLGNGALGCVIWGANPLIFTLDHISFWVRSTWRPDPEYYKWKHIKQLIREGLFMWECAPETVKREDRHDEELNRLRSLEMTAASRLMASRLEIYFPEIPKKLKMSLDLYSAMAEGSFHINTQKIRWRAMTHARHDAFILEMDTSLIQPKIKFCTDPEFAAEVSAGSKDRWGTPLNFLKHRKIQSPETRRHEDKDIISQNLPDGGQLALGWSQRESSGKILICVALDYTRSDSARVSQDSSAVSKVVKTLSAVQNRSFDDLLKEHKDVWKKYYGSTFVSIPNTRLEAFYWMETYKLRSTTRPGAAAISLQGVWSSDGKIPPYDGDYHHDMNVQTSYWPVYTANKLELAGSLHDFIENCRPVWKKFCRDVFEREGEFVPVATDIDGNPQLNNVSFVFEFENGPWLAHMLWWYWRYSQDKTFLEKQAFPFMKAVMACLSEELREGEDKQLHLEWSTSAEYFGRNKGGNLWGPDATIDLSLLKWMAEALIESSAILNIQDPNLPQWKDIAARIKPYSLTKDVFWRTPPKPVLAVRSDLPLVNSHRHHSHLMPIFPLKTLRYEDASSKDLIRNSVIEWEYAGRGEWHNMSYGWAAAIAAHSNRADLARSILLEYLDRMITANSFPLCGRDMTLEAGFASMTGMQEMLLQSHEGKILVFPAMPDCWPEASFHNLRAEGAFLVSACRKGGYCRFIRIHSETGGPLAIGANFKTRKVKICDETGLTKATLPADKLSYQFSKGETVFILPATYNGPIPSAIPVLHGNRKEWHYFGTKRVPRP